MGLFDLFKKNIKTETIEAPVLFRNEFLIVGNEYPCKKNKKIMRNSVHRKMKIGAIVNLEYYRYNKQPAYMVVDPKTGLDLGVLSHGAASWIHDEYRKKLKVCKICEKFRDTYRISVVIYDIPDSH